MSYEVATELCDLSAKTIGNIACRKSVASLTSLEKLCTGLGKSPNELLSNIDEQQATTYRFPMNVSNAKIFRSTFGFSAFHHQKACAGKISTGHADRSGIGDRFFASLHNKHVMCVPDEGKVRLHRGKHLLGIFVTGQHHSAGF